MDIKRGNISFSDIYKGDTNLSSVYIGSTEIWSFSVTDLTPARIIYNPETSGQSGDRFGYDIDISGDNMVVSSYQYDDTYATGRAYIIDLTDDSVSLTLESEFPTSWIQFGTAVGINTNNVCIGAPYKDDGATDKGQAYLYNNSTGSLIATLDATDIGINGIEFGSQIFMNDSYLLVASDTEIAQFNPATGAHIRNIAAPTGGVDTFGENKMYVYFDTLVVDAGAIDLYDLTDGSLIDTISTAAHGVYMDSNYIYVGNERYDTISRDYVDSFNVGTNTVRDMSSDGTNVGITVHVDGSSNDNEVFIFDAANKKHKYRIFDTNTSSALGRNLLLHNNKAYVPAFNDDTDGSNAGILYVYDL